MATEQTSTHDLTCSVTQSLIQFTAHVILTPTYQLFTPFSGLIYYILLFYPFPISTYNLARLTTLPAPPGHLSPVTENIYIHNVLRTLCNNCFSSPLRIGKTNVETEFLCHTYQRFYGHFYPAQCVAQGVIEPVVSDSFCITISRLGLVAQNASPNVAYSTISACRCRQMRPFVSSSPRIVL